MNGPYPHTSTCDGPVCFPDVNGGWTQGGITIFAVLVLAILLVTTGIIILVKYGLPFVRSIGRNVQTVKEQVVNSHSTNFREENDERHAEVLDAVKGLGESISDLRANILDVRGDIRTVRGEVRAVSDRTTHFLTEAEIRTLIADENAAARRTRRRTPKADDQ